MSDVPITFGSGQASVATERVGARDYQIIKVVGAETGSTSVLGVNPDRSINVSVVGAVQITGSVVALTSGNQSVSGAVTAQAGSVMTVAMLAGSVAAVTATAPAGSILSVTNPAGSVTAVSATFAAGSIATVVNPAGSVTTVVFQNSSIFTNQTGSVITVWQNPSIAGTYAEDSGHTTADKGIFVLGVRNDAVASFVSANLEYTPMGVDSAGRSVTKPFAAEEARIEGYNSVVSTSVTTLVAAAGTGLRNYITDIQIANTGATTTLITFRSGGGTSVLGYTIAPTGGGSNITFQTPMRTLANETFDFQPTTASSVLFATVKGFKAP